MNLQDEIKALKERIAELEEQAKEEQEFPQDGDEYHYIEASGRVERIQWDESGFDLRAQEIGNIFRTKEQAEFAVGKLKVEAELQKFSRPFESMEDNFFIVFNTEVGSLNILCRLYSKYQGTIYFESKEKAQQAIDAVGAERIKKYIFGVED